MSYEIGMRVRNIRTGKLATITSVVHGHYGEVAYYRLRYDGEKYPPNTVRYLADEMPDFFTTCLARP